MIKRVDDDDAMPPKEKDALTAGAGEGLRGVGEAGRARPAEGARTRRAGDEEASASAERREGALALPRPLGLSRSPSSPRIRQ